MLRKCLAYLSLIYRTEFLLVFKFLFIISIFICLCTRMRHASFVPVCAIQCLPHLQIFRILKHLYSELPLNFKKNVPELERLNTWGKQN